MAGRLAGDQEPNRSSAAIDGLMQFAGSDLEALVRVQLDRLPLDNQGQLAGQHKEELARMDVVVRRLPGAWGASALR